MFPEFLGLTQLTWQALAALTGVATLLTAGIAARVAYRQYQANQEVREEQSRPYVVADFDPSVASSHLFDIVIKNIGKTPALDVKIRLDPAPKRARETPKFPLSEARVFSDTLPMLAPGRELRLFFDSMPERYKTELPMSYSVKATYRNARGRVFNETAVVDMDVRRGSMYTEVFGVHHVAKSLREIQKLQKELVRHLRNPIHVTTEEFEDYGERLREEATEMRRQQEELVAQFRPKPPDESTSPEGRNDASSETT